MVTEHKPRTRKSKSKSLSEIDPKGRMDVALYRVAERAFSKFLQPKLQSIGVNLNWDEGLGKLVELEIRKSVSSKRLKIPKEVGNVIASFNNVLNPNGVNYGN